MAWFNRFWTDERGGVVSAELLLLGTLGVAGVGYGLGAVGSSVDAELKELAFSIRSLDQSYSLPAQTGCNGAWSAGSCFKQQDVAVSIEELKSEIREAEAKHKQHAGQSADESIEAAPAPADAPLKPADPAPIEGAPAPSA